MVMEPKPVHEHKSPSYPTRREVLAGAATFALASLAGSWQVLGATETGVAIVAPIFEHGTGRGATGCIVLSPPVFLSEEEAMQIIREELAKHDVHLKEGKILDGVRLFRRHPTADKKHGEQIKELNFEDDPELQKDPRIRELYDPKVLKLDGVDSDKKVAVEFVSETDYPDLGGVLSPSSVQHYDFKDVAKYVAGKVTKESKDRVYFGVFYDPATKWKDSEVPVSESEADMTKRWKKEKEETKNESRKLLRQQVQDFAGWLKEKKVVP
jgi:hypothetical protein